MSTACSPKDWEFSSQHPFQIDYDHLYITPSPTSAMPLLDSRGISTHARYMCTYKHQWKQIIFIIILLWDASLLLITSYHYINVNYLTKMIHKIKSKIFSFWKTNHNAILFYFWGSRICSCFSMINIIPRLFSLTLFSHALPLFLLSSCTACFWKLIWQPSKH